MNKKTAIAALAGGITGAIPGLLWSVLAVLEHR